MIVSVKDVHHLYMFKTRVLNGIYWVSSPSSLPLAVNIIDQSLWNKQLHCFHIYLSKIDYISECLFTWNLRMKVYVLHKHFNNTRNVNAINYK